VPGTLRIRPVRDSETNAIWRVVLETASALCGARALYRSLGYERTGSRSHPVADVELVRFEREFE
jgi:hypothetical protein